MDLFHILINESISKKMMILILFDTFQFETESLAEPSQFIKILTNIY